MQPIPRLFATLPSNRLAVPDGLPLLVAALLSFPILACSDAPSRQAGSAADNAATETGPEGVGSGSASSSSSAASGDAMPPLPDAASSEGKLPRTYAGYTLGDPPPASAETLDGPPPFYPEATQLLVRLSDAPKTNVSLYVHDDAIFRIEWRVKEASLDRDAVAEAFSERLGPPEEPSEYLPTQHVYWSDGLTDGDTTITVFRIVNGEWFRVAFEDTGRAAALLGRK